MTYLAREVKRDLAKTCRPKDKNPRPRGRGFVSISMERPLRELFKGLHEALELVFETGHAAPAIQKCVCVTSPGSMCGWIDIKYETIPFFAISRARLILGAIGHHNGDEVIIWMSFGFHDPNTFVLVRAYARVIYKNGRCNRMRNA